MAANRLRQAVLLCQCIIACVALSDAGAEDRRQLAPDGAQLLFREDWKTTLAELPITQTHVATRGLVLGLHGPGSRWIKKSHHDQPADDPYYLWSGQCQMRWAFSLRPAAYFVDLSAKDARLRLRTKQSGDRELYVLIKLPGERWYIGDV